MVKHISMMVLLMVFLAGLTACGSDTETQSLNQYTDEQKQLVATTLGLVDPSGYEVLEFRTEDFENAPQSWKIKVNNPENMEKIYEMSPEPQQRDEELGLDAAAIAGAFQGLKGAFIDPEELVGFSVLNTEHNGWQFNMYYIVMADGTAFLDLSLNKS